MQANKDSRPTYNNLPNTVEIITIGDEILIGQIVDTNSAWISAELNKSGFQISQITSVHDAENHILETLDFALSKNDIVLLTGGLGPTKDDITKTMLCKYFDTKLVYSTEVYRNIEKLFAHRPAVMNKLTESQAMVPENCTVIQNNVGTAPIMWFKRGEKVVVSMPGVPFEMKKAMADEIIPRLREQFRTKPIIHQTVQVYGYGESTLALKIAEWEENLPKDLHLAYLPSFGIVKLRISGTSDDKSALKTKIDSQIKLLEDILGESIIAKQDISIEELLNGLLKNKGLTVSTAESCTGGNIAHRITLIPGSSAVFKGSVVAYDNEVKENVLNVSASDLNQYGAVSRQVVEQMADGVRKRMQTDLAVAVSGVAGPEGGTDDKPVGTVWIAVSGMDYIENEKFQFGDFPRDVIVERATTAAIMMLWKKINEL
ncbi:MAG: competence/damage-inducible protein A [Paludibacteraceae bacterium]